MDEDIDFPTPGPTAQSDGVFADINVEDILMDFPDTLLFRPIPSLEFIPSDDILDVIETPGDLAALRDVQLSPPRLPGGNFPVEASTTLFRAASMNIPLELPLTLSPGSFATPYLEGTISSPPLPTPSYEMPPITQRALVHYPTPLPSAPRATPPTQKEWDAKKHILQNLYIDHNLNLEDIIPLMKERHNFYATPKMYKMRFKMWEWRKYREGKHPRRKPGENGHSRTCVRRNDARVQALLHESEATGLVERAVSALRSFLVATVQKDDQWRLSALSCFHKPDTKETRTRGYLATALHHFRRGDNTVGGVYLRYSFIQLEIQLRDVKFLEVIQLTAEAISYFLLPGLEHTDILRIYLLHLGRLSAAYSIQHPVYHIAGLLLGLLQLNSKQLIQYVDTALRAYGDIIEQRVIGIDRAMWLSRTSRMVILRWMGLSDAHPEWTGKRLISDYEELIQKTAKLGDEAEIEMLTIQDDILAHMYITGIYSDDFVERNERLQEAVRSPYQGTDLPIEQWEDWHAWVYARTCIRLVYFYLWNGKQAKAFEYLPDVFRLFSAGLDNEDENSEVIIRSMEMALRESGCHSKIKDADKLRKLMQDRASLLEDQAMEEDISVYEVIDEL